MMDGDSPSGFFSIFVESRGIAMKEPSVVIEAHPTQGLPPELVAGQAFGIIQ
jgi:hypothetical protein